MRQDIEILRVFSMFGIVWFHTQNHLYSDIAYAGLTIFLILSILLSGQQSKPVHVRAQRLLIPWAIWILIYGVCNLVMHKPLSPAQSSIGGVLSGTSFHLWFLPYIFLMLVLFDSIKQKISTSVLVNLCGGMAIVILLSCPLWRFESLTIGYPYSQWAHASIGVFIGAFFWALPARPRRIEFYVLAGIIAAETITIPFKGVGLPYLIGTLMIAAVKYNNKTQWSFDITPISNLMFGVYLIHPLIMGVYSGLHIPATIIKPIFVFAMSAAVVYAIKKIPWRGSRYLV